MDLRNIIIDAVLLIAIFAVIGALTVGLRAEIDKVKCRAADTEQRLNTLIQALEDYSESLRTHLKQSSLPR